MPKPKILIIEDDKELSEVMALLLKKDYTTVCAEDGLLGLKQALRDPPDLILLDIKMPNMDGLQACQLIRKDPEYAQIPILVVSGYGGEDDRVRALEAGADDFIAKPFDSTEFLLRIQKRLESSASARARKQMAVLERAQLRMDLSEGRVLVAGQEVHFSQIEFQILQLLLKAGEKVVSREEILESVWGASAESSRVMDPHIVSIRNKLSGSGLIIHAVYRKGYTLKPTEV